MADLDRRYAQGTTVGRAEAGVIDQGLRAYMIRVYNYMASGVAITGVVAYADLCHVGGDRRDGGHRSLTPFGNFMFASAFKWVVIFAPLGYGVLPLGAHQFDEPRARPRSPSGYSPR